MDKRKIKIRKPQGFPFPSGYQLEAHLEEKLEYEVVINADGVNRRAPRLISRQIPDSPHRHQRLHHLPNEPKAQKDSQIVKC